MNLNLVDLSNNVEANYQGKFNDVFTTINEAGRTLLNKNVLDREKIMNNRQLIEKIKLLKNEDIEQLAKCTNISVSIIQNIFSSLEDLDVNIKENVMKGEKGENVQIGEQFVEINNLGDGVTNNYAGLLENAGLIKDLKMKIVNLENALKEKEDLIASMKETIELLKKK